MTAWFRRFGDEEGISLVEMLVSILILGLVLAALGNTLFSSMAAARQNEGLTQATAVANEELEEMQSMPWANLTQATFAAPETISRGGRDYTATKTVAWIDQPHFKRYTVSLTWTEDGQPHSVSVQGKRARRAGESNTPAAPINPFRVLTFTVNPDPVNLDTTSKTLAATNPALPGGAAMLLEVELNEAARAGSVNVTWPTAQSLVLTEVAGSAGRKWSGTIPSGQTLPNGWLPFRVTAAKAATATICTADPLPASADCTESTSAAYLMAPIVNGQMWFDNNDVRMYTGTPGPAADRLCMAGAPSRLRNNNPVYLGLQGLGVDDTVTMSRTDVGGISYPMTWTNLGANGWWWVATLTTAGSGTYTVGTNSTWQISWTRSYDNLTGTIPLTFRSIAGNGASPC